MTEAFLPFALPDIGEAEIDEVVDSLRSGWLTTGPKVRRFEQDFAERLAMPEAIAVNSATAGLHLALEAFGLSPGDRVLTTPFTFTASAEVIRYLGADPIFADIDEATCNLDPNCAATLLAREKGIRFLLPVHYAGQSCEMDALLALAREHGLTVIEDAAHAFPTSYGERWIGQLGDATVFSFYATKSITTGEGGMIVLRDREKAARMRVMRLHGISRDVFERYSAQKPSWYYEVVAPGFKYNLTDLAAALGIHQLARAETMRLAREAIANTYLRELDDLPCRLPLPARPADTHAWHLFPLQLELDALSIDRDRFIELMCAAGIGTSVHFIPLHQQPYWRDRYHLRDQDFPVATRVARRIVSLPIYSRMSAGDVDRVVTAVRRLLRQFQR